MGSARLQQLRSLLAQEPGDLFLRYAIALELKRQGDNDQAITHLEQMVRDVPHHIATYYQLALLLAERGCTNDALHVCDVGLLQCTVAGDRKARAELQGLRHAITDEV